MNFVDQTGNALDMVEPLPDAFSTVLQQNGRFSLYDRGQLRQLDRGQLRQKGKRGSGMLYETYPTEPPYGVKPSTNMWYYSSVMRRVIQVQEDIESMKSIRREVDAVLMGSITSRNEAAVTVDYRLVSSVFQHVIHAGTVKVPYRKGGGEVEVEGEGESQIREGLFSFDRAALTTETQKIARYFPDPVKLKEGKVLSIRGEFVIIDVGRAHGIFPGLVAFIFSPKKLLLHPTPDQSIPEDIYRGQIYVTSVYGETSQAFVYSGLGNLKVGDRVRFR